jgi:hypothetical protein
VMRIIDHRRFSTMGRTRYDSVTPPVG